MRLATVNNHPRAEPPVVPARLGCARPEAGSHARQSWAFAPAGSPHRSVKQQDRGAPVPVDATRAAIRLTTEPQSRPATDGRPQHGQVDAGPATGPAGAHPRRAGSRRRPGPRAPTQTRASGPPTRTIVPYTRFPRLIITGLRREVVLRLLAACRYTRARLIPDAFPPARIARRAMAGAGPAVKGRESFMRVLLRLRATWSSLARAAPARSRLPRCRPG